MPHPTVQTRRANNISKVTNTTNDSAKPQPTPPPLKAGRFARKPQFGKDVHQHASQHADDHVPNKYLKGVHGYCIDQYLFNLRIGFGFDVLGGTFEERNTVQTVDNKNNQKPQNPAKNTSFPAFRVQRPSQNFLSGT